MQAYKGLQVLHDHAQTIPGVAQGHIEGGINSKHKPKNQKALMFVNYKPVEIMPGEEALIEVCLRQGIVIPKFCYHPELSVAGNCRMCMVQVAGTQMIIVACATPVMAGMSILTDTRLTKGAREGNMELIFINHPLDCPVCAQHYDCDLQEIGYAYGSCRGRYRADKLCVMDKRIDPQIMTSFNRCIYCTRCTRWVQEHTKEWTWGMCGRGGMSEITGFLSTDEKRSKTHFWENANARAAHLCPVGALTTTACQRDSNQAIHGYHGAQKWVNRPSSYAG